MPNPQKTFPQLLLEKSRQWGDERIAMRHKEFGVWHPLTWADYYQAVEAVAMGLASLGFKRGEHVCILGQNEREWVFAELAVQALGGVAIGIYPDSTEAEVHYIVEKSDAVYVFVQDQEQTDKLLAVKDKLAEVRKVIYWDSKGLRNYDDELLIFFEDLQEAGRQHQEKQPDFLMKEINKGNPEDVGVILTTSGTTSLPKLAMLSYLNMLTMAEDLFLHLDPMNEGDEFVSFLPLPWVGEHMTCIAAALLIGFTVNFPEEPATVRENLREIAPRVMFSPPSVWEGMLSTIQVKIEDTSRLKRWLYQRLMPIGYQKAEAALANQELGSIQKWRYRLAHILLFRALQDRLGMSGIRNAYSGGAALGPDVFKFFHAIGVNLKQLYGQTEISGISVAHHDADIKFETVGKPLSNTELKIAENGEILSRSPSVFQGYYKDPDASSQILQDGWLHSGDAGYLDDDGHLVVIDRLKDVMQLADGNIFSPQFIENKLKFSQYVREAVVFGKDRPAITAFINIDFQNTGKWAENRHLAYTTYTDLSQKPEVYKLITKAISEVNEQLPESARIKRFVILHKELDADDQELTRTKKVRRGFIADKYSELVTALYGDQSQVAVTALVKYRDGRQEELKTFVRIEDL